MNPEIPSLPPAGGTAVFPLQVMTATRGAASLSGLLVSRDGRMAITGAGAGLGVVLEPADAIELGLLLLQLGHVMQADADAAALGASEALDRITREVAGNA